MRKTYARYKCITGEPAAPIATAPGAGHSCLNPKTRAELLSAAAMQELDDESLGAFSRQLPWGSYGLLARASLTAPTL